MHDFAASQGYARALSLLHECATPDGFLASIADRDNYRRIWSRDGVIIGLAGLLTGDEKLRNAHLFTLRTLMHNMGPHGEIPSNVDPRSGRVSYGGTAGRVDADLWFLIGCGAYFRSTNDERFLEEFYPAMKKVQFLLGAWEFNTRDLLYVPQTGDWSDEYLQEGYILYDQLLYVRALSELEIMERAYSGEDDVQLHEKVIRLRNLIRTNYWFEPDSNEEEFVYHPIIYRKGYEAAQHGNSHWMNFFSPAGYGYRFDALANVLVSLFDIADDGQRTIVDAFIDQSVVQQDMMLLPAFHPVIMPEDDAWNELQISFSFTFKNNPYEFHNGGLWPFITGLYVTDLAKRGKTDLAQRYLQGIDAANALDAEGDAWGFHEFIHGKLHTPAGTRNQGWSAAASVMGHHALNGSFLLS